MSPSVDIKTPSPRSMKSSLDEAGPPSPIDLDTPEEDKEEREEKKKKKKKKKREDGQDVSQPVQTDVNKEKTKRKRRMEDEGSEVMEREKKRKKGGEEMRREGVEEDVVKEGEEKKRKKKKKNLEEEMIIEVIVVQEGGKKKKNKEKKNNLVEEVIEVVEETMVKEGGKKKKKNKEKKNNLEEVIEVVEETMVKEGGEKKKKKKEKKNNLEEEVMELVEEIVVKEGGEKKKKKKKLGEETVEEDVVNGGEEKKKKKKKIVVDQPIEAIEENVVNEGVDKKKKKKKKIVDQPIEAIEENAVNEGGDKKKKKKKKIVDQPIEAIEENAVNQGGEKKKKKKKKVVEETIERVEENVVTEGGEKKKKKKMGVKLEEKGGGVVELNGDGEKKKTGTTQEAKKKRKKKSATSDEKREGGEEVKNRLPYGKIDNTSRLEDLLAEPEMKEILEYFPLVRSRVVLERIRRYDLHRFREFKKQGISLRRGRLTAEEKRQIRKNVNDFLVLTGITSAQNLFFPHRCKEQSKEIKKLRTQHRFMEKMGEGLHRSCFQVYILAKKMTDELNHMGRFDDEEMHMLQRLHTRHGNDWREIAKSMDRSVESLQKRFAHIASNHGVWESDEEERLKQAMLAHLKTLVGPEQKGSASGPWLTSEQLCKNLPWKRVSEKVQTRCWSQCREKWFGLLKSTMASDHCPAFSGGLKAIKAKVKLINTLYNMDVEDPALIEWDEVAITIGEVSERYVQKTFHRLKVASVPRWNELSYPDIIDYLQDKVVPKLEEHLKEAGDIDLPCEQKYFLSHICSSGEVDSGLTVV